MFKSNSESLQIRNRVCKAPTRYDVDCSLLLSETDPALPVQPGSDGLRFWIPEERQLQQPQTVEEIQEAIQDTSLSLLKSKNLEALLAASSLDDLKKQCAKLNIQPLGKLNRLQMAESILFHQSTSESRQRPVLQGKVQLSFMFCRVATVLTSVIPHR